MSKKLEEYTKEELLSYIAKLKKDTKFGLVWNPKDEQVAIDCETKIPVLQEVANKTILKATEDDPVHLLLEGDNYHSLSVLNYTHAGKVDVIYIDPPYNTGNKDFVYNDHFIDKDDAFRHSKWLSFMNNRLRLAKDLLADTGVIFVSIDDNEYAHLKILCDMVFGEENSIGPFIQNKLNAKNDTLNIQKNHEYILVYRKREIKVGGKTIPTLINKKVTTKEVYKEGDKYYYLGDSITTRGEGGILNSRKNLGYTIYYNPESGDFKGEIDYDVELAKTINDESKLYVTKSELVNNGYVYIRPPKVRGKLGAWTWDCNRFNANLDKIFIKKTRSGYIVQTKKFVESEEVYEHDGKYYYDVVNKLGNSKSIIEFSTNDGTDVYNQILEAGSFNNPKNLQMLKFFIGLYDKKDAIILDFFAGSGTTGQAVLELNHDDEGKRQFILGTNNENGIAENITYERISKVIDGYNSTPGIPANLRYYKTDFVDTNGLSTLTDKDKLDITKEMGAMIALRENSFDQVEQTDHWQTYENTSRLTAIYYREDKTRIQEYLDKLNAQDKPVKLYVFGWGKNVGSEYASKKISVEDIPEPLIEVYKEIAK